MGLDPFPHRDSTRRGREHREPYGSSPPNYSRITDQPLRAMGLRWPGDHPPWPNGTEPGPDGSRLRLFLIVVGVVVLVGAAVVVGVLISRRGQPSSTTSPERLFPAKAAIVARRSRRAWSSFRCGAVADPTAPCTWSIRRPRSSESSCRRLGGGNSNPIMQASRNTIIYLNAGMLRVMAADGSGDRKLFNRDPAGCAQSGSTRHGASPTPMCY